MNYTLNDVIRVCDSVKPVKINTWMVSILMLSTISKRQTKLLGQLFNKKIKNKKINEKFIPRATAIS